MKARVVRRGAGLRVVVVALVVGLSCDPKDSEYFIGENFPGFGTLEGTVIDGVVIPAASVGLSGTSRSTTTSAAGLFNFAALVAGTYSIVTTVTGYTCPAAQAQVMKDEKTTVTIHCTPTTGRINGLVRLDGQPRGGATITARNGNATATATSGADGTYSIPSLQPGSWTVTITPPTSTSSCTPSQQTANVQANQTATANFDCTTIPGTVAGTVRVNGVGQAGVSVLVFAGTPQNVVGQATTGADGTYTITGVPPGNYTAGVVAPSGTSCNTQSVTVVSNQTTTANLDCATIAGTVSGSVTVNGVGQAGIPVLITQGGQNIIGQATTGAGGTYTITNVPPGTYVASITPPAGALCNTPQNVTVQANQTSTVNFTCSSMSNSFSVTFGNPPLSWWHPFPGVSSETCVGFSTSPVQPGSIWSSTWTGPGTVGSNQHSGTLDQNGHGVDRQTINQFGTYGVTINVVSNGVSSSASGTVTVTSAPGSCPPP